MKIKSKYLLIVAYVFFAVIFNSCQDVVPNTKARFTVIISNVSTGRFSTLLANGIYFTNKSGFPLFFTSSFDYGEGLENLAEDGDIDILLNNLRNNIEVIESGSFRDFFAGESDTIIFEAAYGDFFNFATMHTDTNDGFYAYDEEGILLFEPDGTPINGDITMGLHLWDAGTERNQMPYEGSFQPSRQTMPNEGVETLEAVRLISSDPDFTYPETREIINVSVTFELLE